MAKYRSLADFARNDPEGYEEMQRGSGTWFEEPSCPTEAEPEEMYRRQQEEASRHVNPSPAQEGR